MIKCTHIERYYLLALLRKAKPKDWDEGAKIGTVIRTVKEGWAYADGTRPGQEYAVSKASLELLTPDERGAIAKNQREAEEGETQLCIDLKEQAQTIVDVVKAHFEDGKQCAIEAEFLVQIIDDCNQIIAAQKSKRGAG